MDVKETAEEEEQPLAEDGVAAPVAADSPTPPPGEDGVVSPAPESPESPPSGEEEAEEVVEADAAGELFARVSVCL